MVKRWRYRGKEQSKGGDRGRGWCVGRGCTRQLGLDLDFSSERESKRESGIRFIGFSPSCLNCHCFSSQYTRNPEMKLYFLFSLSISTVNSFTSLTTSIWGQNLKTTSSSSILKVGSDPNVVTGNDWKPEPGGMQSTVSILSHNFMTA